MKVLRRRTELFIKHKLLIEAKNYVILSIWSQQGVVVTSFLRLFGTSAVVNSALATKQTYSSFVRRKESPLCFVAGQPLGYHASWPLFALSHHVLVWWAAEQVHPGVYFDRYAVLGDDVVIADEEVAKVYEQGLKELGLSIYYHKSLISHSGSAEFAKRFRIRGLTKDVSPVSIRALWNSHHPYGLMAINHK
jgi:hypothetical protein